MYFRCLRFAGGATLARPQIIHSLLFEGVLTAAFLRRTLRFGRCGYFLTF